MSKTIGIIGTRRRDGGDDFDLTLKAFKSVYKSGDRICSGGCPKGGDRFADTIARQTGVPIIVFYPNWRKYSKGAGFVRNGLIAKESDMLIACVAEDRTGGTEDTIAKFKKEHPEGEIILV